MTKEQINEWIKNAKLVDIVCDRDYEATQIYQVGDDPQLWAIYFCNDCMCFKMNNKGYIVLGEYEPVKVTKYIRVVEINEYVEG